MKWHKEYLDLVLVPSGMLLMFGYHLFLLYKYLRNPKSTVLGFEDHCKKAWVKKMMQIEAERRGPAFTVMASTVQASVYMASISLALGSLIGTWIGSTSSNQLMTTVIYGDTGISITSIKYISILLFFLLAFASFVQCARCYVHTNFLLSMPRAEVPEKFVIEALVKGANFWQVGLRGIYFAVNLLFWVFGPIPMFASSVGTVIILYILDVNEKPLHDFHHAGDFVKKVGEDMKAFAAGIRQQDRSYGSELVRA